MIIRVSLYTLGDNYCCSIKLFLTVMLTECPTVLWATTTIVRIPPIPWLVLVTTWGSVTRIFGPSLPLSWVNTIFTAGSVRQDISMNVILPKKFSNTPFVWHVSWVQFVFWVQSLSQLGFTLLAIWSMSQVCWTDVPWTAWMHDKLL